MSGGIRKLLAPALAAWVIAGAGAASAITIKVVDMIPNAQSGEAAQDSEPNLAVDPANAQWMAASAFTPNPMMTFLAPIFYSTNGGDTWFLNPIVPGNSQFKTADITLRFSGSGDRLYIGTIPSLGYMRVYRVDDFTSPVVPDKLIDRSDDDQPWVMATTVIGQNSAGKDRVYVGNNDHTGPMGHTSTIDLSLDGAAAAPPAPANFVSDRLESRGTDGDDLAPVRIATHPDGTVYAIFYASRGLDSVVTDAVVVRDDNWGQNGFTDLKGLSNKPGLQVMQDIVVPVDSLNFALGHERLGGGGNSIAVDPRDSGVVYAAYSDEPGGKLPYILHILASFDRGGTWNEELTVQNAINPTLAVNTVGTIGLLYQQLTAAKIWETHFRRSTHQGLGWDDRILAKFPDNVPAETDLPYLGDYAHLQAVGKDFYGVFSSSNAADKANFPQDVVYQRNANFTTHTLLDIDNKFGVNPSIDPFFFHVTEQDPGNDFYVRDWTDSPLSADNGAEPSTHAKFYVTSDVWNRRSPDPGSFPNDQPEQVDAGNGASPIGDNWAFARIWRRNDGTAQTVSAHFLVSQFGVGNNYINLSGAMDPTVSFVAGETGPKVTVPMAWHLDAATSTHACLAVEIQAPGDPLIGGTLKGSAPGWPTDLRILNNNNLAQRNMHLSTTPYNPQSGSKKKLYAIVHNAATFPRDMTLQYTLGDAKRLTGATARVVASNLGPLRAGDPLRLASRGQISIKTVQPGESRWLEIIVPAPVGKTGEELDVDFQEVAADQLMDGFAVGDRLAATDKSIAAGLENHRSVYTRLAALYGFREADSEVKAAQSLLDAGAFGSDTYLRFLGSNLKLMSSALDQLAPSRDGDPFGTRAELDGLSRLYTSAAPVETQVLAHASFLEELDAELTLRQLQPGNTADVLQNVRWQRDLFVRASQLAALDPAASIVTASQSFLADWGNGKADTPDYPVLLRSLSSSLAKVAGLLEPALPGLTVREQAIESAVASGDLAAMQKAHRDFLAQLQTLDNRL